MIGHNRSRVRRLGLLAGVAAAVLVFGGAGIAPLRIALPMGSGDGADMRIEAVRFEGGLFAAAFAQGSDVTLEAVTIDAGSGTVTIPSVTVSGTSLSRETLTALLRGKGDKRLYESFAEIDARSIAAPEIVFEQSTGDDTIVMTYRDVTAENVADGAIGLLTIAASEFEVTSGSRITSGTVGESIVENLDIAFNVRFLTDSAEEGEENPLRTLYGAYSIDGMQITSDEGVEVSIGAIAGDPSEARLLSQSFGQTFRFLQSLDESEDPTAEETALIFTILSDMYSSLRIGGTTIEELSVTVDEMGDEPVFSVALVDVGPNAESTVIETILFRSDEFDGGIERIETAGFDPEAFVAAMRAIVEAEREGDIDPALTLAMLEPMGSMSILGFSGEARIEDQDDPIPISLGAFIVSAEEEIEGATGTMVMSFENLVVTLPEGGTDEFSMQMQALGYETLDISSTLALGWNGDERTLIVDEISVAGADMGGVVITALLGDIGPEIFSTDENVSQMAALQSTLRRVTLSVVDEGLAERGLAYAAAMQGVEAEALRAQVAGAAGGMLPMLLGGTPDSFSLGQAVSTFVREPGELDLVITSNDPAGIPMLSLMGLASDPQQLLGLVTITAEAR